MTPLQNKPHTKKRPPSKRPAQKQPKAPRSVFSRLLPLAKAKLTVLPDLLPEGDVIMKGIVCGLTILFFALLQTTVFSRFRPFGAVPDLMLPLVIAIAMTEGEKWGSVCGIAAAFLIESLGSTGATLLPLLYAAVGYFCPIFTTLYFTDSLPVRALYTVIAGGGRALTTLVYLILHAADLAFLPLMGSVILPEFAATLCLSALPHLAVRFCLHPFHRSREERTGSV